MSKEIIEGNKLIAEFMGKTLYDDKPFMPISMRTDGLEYDSSWSWLMPVVEKISDYHYPNYFSSCPQGHEREPYEDCAFPRTFGMRDKEGNFMVRLNANQLFSASTLIEATWLAVVDFITWYNQQNT